MIVILTDNFCDVVRRGECCMACEKHATARRRRVELRAAERIGCRGEFVDMVRRFLITEAARQSLKS